MNQDFCKGCFWNCEQLGMGVCHWDDDCDFIEDVCAYYTPIDESSSNMNTSDYEQFISEWNTYIKDFD